MSKLPQIAVFVLCLLATNIAQASSISWSTTSGTVLLRFWEAPIFVNGILWDASENINVYHDIEVAKLEYDKDTDLILLDIKTQGANRYDYGPKGTPFPESLSTVLDPVDLSFSSYLAAGSPQFVDLSTGSFHLGGGPGFKGSIELQDKTQLSTLNSYEHGGGAVRLDINSTSAFLIGTLFEVQVTLHDFKPENLQPMPEPSTLLLMSPAFIFMRKFFSRG